MKKKPARLIPKGIYLFILYFSSLNLFATEIKYKDAIENLIVGDKIYLLEDKSNKLTIDDIINHNGFYRSENQTPNLGVSKSTFWIKFTLINASSENKLLLKISQPIINSILLYTPTGKGFEMHYAGDDYPFNVRPYHHPNFIFPLTIKSGEEKTFYLKITSSKQILLPLKIGSPKTIIGEVHHEDILFGIYCGIMLIMFLYNLFIYFTVRDQTYLYYVIHTLFIGLTQTALLGYPFQYLWPDSPYWATLSVYLFPCCVGITGLEFLKKFLNTKELIPKIHRISYFITGLYILTAVVSLSGIMHIGYMMVQVVAVIVALYMLLVAILLSRKGSKPAKFFLIAWSSMLVGIIIFVLKDFNVLPTNIFTSYTMPAGSALETLLLSFALADRINILKKEKEDSQAQVVIALQENEKLIKEQNIVLEQKVIERTTELAKTNEELQTTLTDLKETQAQLVDAEKMASLGQLTAGIAHEINNPINFVSANIKPLKMDIEDIISLVDKYESLNEENIKKDLEEINAFKKQIDLDYVKSEIETLLLGIEDGAKRTAEIVTGLKIFSRLDESDVKTADINEGLDSTLTLIRSAIPDNIKIIKNLGNLPIIECYPGKLNQVFMNTLNNAIQAMQKKKGEELTLSISSYVSGENICVTIEDTGTGMTPEIKAKIFEPFFTTKDVGEGTGLGMSIVFKIIEKHNGKIDIDTEPGRGTKITFTLPMKLNLS